MSEPIQVACVQMSCVESVEDNLRRAEQWIEQAASQGAQLVCLQELFAMRYPCQTEDASRFDLAEPIPGPTTERLGSLAARTGVVIVAGLFERRTAGLYHNTAVVIDADGTLAGSYRKMHIPDDPGYYEKFYFAPGDLGFRAFKTAVAKVGVCVCWDQWFPEAARLTALRGAEVIVYPTAIGWLPEDKEAYGAQQVAAWRTMMISHAIANGVFVVAPNRVGVEGGVEFWGHSFICDPSGVVLVELDPGQEGVIAASCPLDQIDVVRTHWPFLRDRRVDAYGGMSRLLLDGADAS